MAPWGKAGRCDLCGKPIDDHKLPELGAWGQMPLVCPPPETPRTP